MTTGVGAPVGVGMTLGCIMAGDGTDGDGTDGAGTDGVGTIGDGTIGDGTIGAMQDIMDGEVITAGEDIIIHSIARLITITVAYTETADMPITEVEEDIITEILLRQIHLEEDLILVQGPGELHRDIEPTAADLISIGMAFLQGVLIEMVLLQEVLTGTEPEFHQEITDPELPIEAGLAQMQLPATDLTGPAGPPGQFPDIIAVPGATNPTEVLPLEVVLTEGEPLVE